MNKPNIQSMKYPTFKYSKVFFIWGMLSFFLSFFFFFVGKGNSQMSGEKSSFSMLKHLKREEAGGIESLCFVWMGGLCGTPLHFLRESSVELVRQPCSLVSSWSLVLADFFPFSLSANSCSSLPSEPSLKFISTERHVWCLV